MGEEEIPGHALVVVDSAEGQGEYLKMVHHDSDQLGEAQASPLVNAVAHWEELAPLVSIHPSNSSNI